MNKRNKITLVTGASRSGKSEFAEILAKQSDLAVVYVATAKIDPTDQEWQQRIVLHQQRRSGDWQTLALQTQDLIEYLPQANASQCLLIDSLGTWVANFLSLESTEWDKIGEQLLNNLQMAQAEIILVGEETGWGLVPAYPLGRLFRDRLGYLSRQIGNIANSTYLVAGGHVLNLSLLGKPLSDYEI